MAKTKIVITEKSCSMRGNKKDILTAISSALACWVEDGTLTKKDVENIIFIATASEEDLAKKIEEQKQEITKKFEEILNSLKEGLENNDRKTK